MKTISTKVTDTSVYTLAQAGTGHRLTAVPRLEKGPEEVYNEAEGKTMKKIDIFRLHEGSPIWHQCYGLSIIHGAEGGFGLGVLGIKIEPLTVSGKKLLAGDAGTNGPVFLENSLRRLQVCAKTPAPYYVKEHEGIRYIGQDTPEGFAVPVWIEIEECV